MDRIDDITAKELIGQVKEIAEKGGISLQKLLGVVSDTRNQTNEVIEKGEQEIVEEIKAKELIGQVKEIAEKGGISLQKLLGVVSDIRNQTNEVIEKGEQEIVEEIKENPYSGFGNPDEYEKEKIDSWSEEYREKVKGKIEFGVNTNKGPATILTLPNRKKLIFDKSPFGDSDTKKKKWNESCNFARSNGRKLPFKEDFVTLFGYFKGDNNELLGILNLKNTEYWAKRDMPLDNNNSDKNCAWCGNFSDSKIYNNHRFDDELYTLYIHQ